ncbi:4Fe-4S binding protein [Saccharicrinis fermentans]|uniref:Ferredoxin n=2 Tax=Saccharicrinis fermentans TaxID=982 RepID=W7YL10_9BACT|nr:4Fe-4S binding protein [Saccharicrinis fermentans]GAF05201.1 ferredoxin [Saccharicrinis fermentans DSM 9555 = JCM 21142]
MYKSYVSVSGMTASTGSMGKKAISISGAVRNIGSNKLDAIFEKNKYMSEIYPTAKSRTALEVFCLYRGQGEYFDLSTKPITRGSFSFGGQKLKTFGYYISDNCHGCGLCVEKCPQNCIDSGTPFEIKQEHCLHCGNCYEVCPKSAVIKLK